jgi:hypothetical protein
MKESLPALAFFTGLLFWSVTVSAGDPEVAIEALLHKVEQQIYANHTNSPPGDSAADTWKQVAQAVPATEALRAHNALTTFAIHLRRRASDEKKAGNTTVSEDMSAFVDRAELLKAHMADRTIEEKPIETLSQPPKFEPLAGSLPPVVNSPPAHPKPAVAAPEFPKGPVKPSEAAFYAWRGDLLLARKDVSAARKYYEFAAGAGNARAAMQLARLNDPAFVPGPEIQPPAHRRVRAWRARARTPAKPEDAESDAIKANGSTQP